MAEVTAAIDPLVFRNVLGQYPTGVCVVTAMHEGQPMGMVVGSFTSVSLAPPLVAFLPAKHSSTWAMLSRSPKFCVNILSAVQESACRKLSSKDPDKFAGVPIELSPNGSPILGGAVAWIDCDVHSMVEAGDHFIVICQVTQLQIANGGLPLLFFQGGYGRFAPSSLVASDTHELLTEQLWMVNVARGEMEKIVSDTGGQCIAAIRLGDELIIAASAGQSEGDTPGLPVGSRLPFAPPFGSTFTAWLPSDQIDRWIGRGASDARRQACREALAAVRHRGFAVIMLDVARLGDIASKFESPPVPSRPGRDLEGYLRVLEVDPSGWAAQLGPDTRMISAPIFDAKGQVSMSLTLHGFAVPASEAKARGKVARLLEGADLITHQLGGRKP